MTDQVEVRRCLSAREADRTALVLAAMGIASRQVPMPLGVGLFVAAADAARARHELAAYEHENAPRRRAAAPPKRLHEGWPAALAYALLLLFFHGAARRDLWSIDWLQTGAVQAGLMRAGEWWRAVTALTLHLDHGHLVGNLFAGAAIGTLAAQLLGPGLAWLAILVAGALANLLAAAMRAADHTAIGASTAVFAALGIVSAFTRQRRWLQRDLRLRRLAPLGAGVLLLAYLGFGGERTDVGAHVAGFAVGLAFGWFLARWHELVPHGTRAQWRYGGLAAGVLLVSWVIALAVR
jgi:membrane associated rhomboid family serine protease